MVKTAQLGGNYIINQCLVLELTPGINLKILWFYSGGINRVGKQGKICTR